MAKDAAKTAHLLHETLNQAHSPRIFNFELCQQIQVPGRQKEDRHHTSSVVPASDKHYMLLYVICEQVAVKTEKPRRTWRKWIGSSTTVPLQWFGS